MVLELRTRAEIRDHVGRARRRGRRVGLVPTMGALHDGHGSLIARARSECDDVVVSIFVNPTQFGPGEDFERYPRSSGADFAFAATRGADAVFAPELDEIYPGRLETRVEPGREARGLCADFRPGHFAAVATIVLKLVNIVGPDRAYFGEKDLQQLAVVRRMVADLDVPVEIVACPIVREADGLAMSSRNRYLSADDRRRALALPRALEMARQRVRDGEVMADRVCGAARDALRGEDGLTVDYVELVDPSTMQALERVEAGARIAAAVRLGSTRLIDNVECGPPSASESGSGR